MNYTKSLDTMLEVLPIGAAIVIIKEAANKHHIAILDPLTGKPACECWGDKNILRSIREAFYPACAVMGN